MQAPVSMLASFAAKSNTAVLLGLLVGFAVLASVKASPSVPSRTPRVSP